MRVHAHFGSTRKYELQHAIMVYSDSSRSFATVHKPLCVIRRVHLCSEQGRELRLISFGLSLSRLAAVRSPKFSHRMSSAGPQTCWFGGRRVLAERCSSPRELRKRSGSTEDASHIRRLCSRHMQEGCSFERFPAAYDRMLTRDCL